MSNFNVTLQYSSAIRVLYIFISNMLMLMHACDSNNAFIGKIIHCVY